MLKTAFCDCLGRDTYKTPKSTDYFFRRLELKSVYYTYNQFNKTIKILKKEEKRKKKHPHIMSKNDLYKN